MKKSTLTLLFFVPFVLQSQILPDKDPFQYPWNPTAVDTVVGVCWNANKEDDLAGYYLRVHSNHTNDKSIPSTLYVTDTGLDTAVVVLVKNFCQTEIDSLYFSVTAYDRSGNVSLPSDTVGTISAKEFVLKGDNDRSGRVSVWDIEFILPSVGADRYKGNWLLVYERYDWIPDGRHTPLDLEFTIINAGNRLR